MNASAPTILDRLKQSGRKDPVLRIKHQRPKVQDAGKKWRITYWDYSAGKKQHRTKTWLKRKLRSERAAQQEADRFMDEINQKNNDLRLYAPDNDTLLGLFNKLKALSWPFLKKPSREQYTYFFETHLIPGLGQTRLSELDKMQLQEFFNSFIGKKSSKTIRLMHGTLRAAFNEAVEWKIMTQNPAIGIRLPKKRPAKPPVVLTFPQIRAMIETLPEPTKTIVILIVFGSMRVGESLALRWEDILVDRIVIDERLYDDDLDEPKTLSGNREVPLDQLGVMKEALGITWKGSEFHEPKDFIFATRNRTPTERRNVLRHVKAAARKLGLPKEVDFRSFRTMHASLMRYAGARAEVARDNMGHAECPTTLDVYSKTWWDERQAAVSAVVNLVMNADEKSPTSPAGEERKMLFPVQTNSVPGVPSSVPAPKMVQSMACK